MKLGNIVQSCKPSIWGPEEGGFGLGWFGFWRQSFLCSLGCRQKDFKLNASLHYLYRKTHISKIREKVGMAGMPLILSLWGQTERSL